MSPPLPPAEPARPARGFPAPGRAPGDGGGERAGGRRSPGGRAGPPEGPGRGTSRPCVPGPVLRPRTPSSVCRRIKLNSDGLLRRRRCSLLLWSSFSVVLPGRARWAAAGDCLRCPNADCIINGLSYFLFSSKFLFFLCPLFSPASLFLALICLLFECCGVMAVCGKQS